MKNPLKITNVTRGAHERVFVFFTFYKENIVVDPDDVEIQLGNHYDGWQPFPARQWRGAEGEITPGIVAIGVPDLSVFDTILMIYRNDGTGVVAARQF